MKYLLLIILLLPLDLYCTNYDDSIAINKAVVKILKQEKERWKDLHETPYNDEVKLSQDGDEIVIDIIIDTGPKNVINSENIVRKYTFPAKTEQPPKYVPNSFGIAAGYVYGQNVAPILYAGYNFLPYKSIYIGPYTSLLSIGACIYYRSEAWHNMTFLVGIGYNVYNQLSPALGIGVSF